MKRSTPVILALLPAMLLASCQNGAGADTSSVAVTNAGNSETSAESTVLSEIPSEYDYGGYKFRILTTDEVGSIRYSYEIDAEKENGDIINDAVFRRNTAVEDKLNIEITQLTGAKDSFYNSFMNSVMADDDDYDALIYSYQGILQMAGDCGLELSKLPGIDIDEPWWDGDFMRQTAIAGKIYGLTGDINIVDNASVWCLLFNRRLADEYSDESLYDIVNDGKWTLDRFHDLAKAATVDLNGDNKLDLNDQWGATVSANIGAGMLWSCGGRLSSLNSDGSVSLTLSTERNLEALSKIREVINDSSSNLLVDTMKAEGSVWVAHRKLFNDGHALFIGGPLSYVDFFRDMKDEYGVIPLPKLDETQQDYIATAQEWAATMLMVPVNAPDPERTSIILDSMCQEASSTIIPAYYDVVLRTKLTRDAESYDMLQKIFASRSFDLSYAYNWGKLRSLTASLMSASNTLSSDLASMKTAVESDCQKNYDKLMNTK